IEQLEQKVADYDAERNFRHFWFEELSFINSARPPKLWFSALESTTLKANEGANAAPAINPLGAKPGGGGLFGSMGNLGNLANLRGRAGMPGPMEDAVKSSGFPTLGRKAGGLSGASVALSDSGGFGGRGRDERNQGSSRGAVATQ